VTVRNLLVVKVDSEKGLLFLKGAVPGKRAAILEIFN
jgi:ribosomal protein L3